MVSLSVLSSSNHPITRLRNRQTLWLLALALFTLGCGAQVARDADPPAADPTPKLIAAPADKALHKEYLAFLETQPDRDLQEAVNQQYIIDAFGGKFPSDWASHMHSLASVINHQAWHFITKNKKSALAEALVLKALELKPDECDYLDTLAELQFRTGKVDEAVKTMKKALAQTTDRGRPMGGCKRKYLEDQLTRFRKEVSADSDIEELQ